MTIASGPLAGRMARRAAQIRPAKAQAFEVKENQFLQITDMAGKQVADFIAFNLHDFDEYHSPAHTRAANNSLMLQKEHGLFSNRRNRMFTMIEDTVGRHDLLFPSCDARRYLDDYGIAEHLNCRDNFLAALKERGYEFSYDRLPDPVNFFMHVALKARGEFEIREPLSGRNDHVILKAHMDTLVAVSACPQDQNACNGFNPTDVLIRVYA
jgi:uncharacterized protein YcgI (DUF1989 family)